MDGWMVSSDNKGTPKPLARKSTTAGTLGSDHPSLDLGIGRVEVELLRRRG
ncbi:hypothetical protein LCGC14_1200820 [marine sediment metagenome]|uniref:Uncharacterized protein n=1 Tax=marine sediment metagenome TaxID=412755 RepID=A0A0F9M488_9ZZZZ